MTPVYDEELRERAAKAYEATRSVRGTAKLIGRSVGWTHSLLVDTGQLGKPNSRAEAQKRRRLREAIARLEAALPADRALDELDPGACESCGSDAIDEDGICHGCGATGQLP